MSTLTAKEKVDTYIQEQADVDLLRFITCGSVDDGKSTLIGRLLYEAQMIFDDQVQSLRADSKRHVYTFSRQLSLPKVEFCAGKGNFLRKGSREIPKGQTKIELGDVLCARFADCPG